MNIVFFGHPKHSGFRSIDSFTEMLSDGMKKRGHHVEILIPEEFVSKLSMRPLIRKWLGYFDQFVLFPFIAKRRISKYGDNTIYVFTDQALGPWVRLVADKHHVIHCHDFLALKSAEGQFKENITGFTGKLYQTFIKRGYQKGKHFISVSKSTDDDLDKYLANPSASRKVVYNGLKSTFKYINQESARKYIKAETGLDISNGYLLHVGGNQWYKNRKGVVEIYDAFRKNHQIKLPLLLIGDRPSADLDTFIKKSEFKDDIHAFPDRSDKFIQNGYAGASALLFPSVAEGFGWPIAEAMACGTIAITTNNAPMTEVGGSAAFYIEPKPKNSNETETWASECAEIVNKVVCLEESIRSEAIKAGLLNVKRFNLDERLDEIESIYINIEELSTE